ncbi:coA-substrate-specific enzyme activase [Fusobacterium sp. CAG:439]|nr:coA-substrate-specific enzyme activase [Fusobacterium sp. CAG:439]HIT92506.1 2-hydroxyglutaryl-CoA dehydratase [Candidatus Stercorousia faecigallinarum]
MSLTVYLGIDVGSVTTKLALVDEKGKYVDSYMLRTAGKPVMAVQKGLNELYAKRITDYDVMGVGTTGSGRNLAGALVGADIIKNEITAHAVAASINVPGVQTILEIGGQDSKIIILRDGIVTDFAMNTVCAAGTGSFLDQQANRLNVPIQDFGATALKSANPARIAGRCGVFAESDLIHKQQLGYPVEDLLYGLCQALVRNYLSNLALGKELLPVFSFQGGVATNSGMVKAFEEALGHKVVVPDNHQTMGAIGAALLAMENHQYTEAATKFKGWQVGEMHFHSITCDCTGCSNNCEVITIVEGEQEIQHVEKIKDIKGNIIARWGGTCGRWDIS